MKANTSCVAPASVYMEGSRGKRFLCDYHFHYEKLMTIERTPEQWPSIAEFLIDNREDLKSKFPDPETSDRDSFGACWCGREETYVKLSHKKNKSEKFFCTFHYHKLLYRYLSNNVEIERDYLVVDERKHMALTLEEDADSVTLI